MKIVCIIDMQKDFINGSLGTPEAEIAAQNAAKWLKENLTAEDKILFTRDTHFENYLRTPEGKQLPIPHCINRTDGWRLWPELLDAIDEDNVEEVINKETFGSRRLADVVYNIAVHKCLTNQEVEVIFMGLCTDICVISNALMVKQVFCNRHDIPIKVLSDCCAGVTPMKHDAALEVMRSCQIDVI